MKKSFFGLFLLFMTTLLMAQPPIQPPFQEVGQRSELKMSLMRGLKQQVYLYRPRSMGGALTDPKGRLGGFTPLYLIYPDQPCDEQQSMSLVKELGIDKQLDEFSVAVGVVNPLGKAYDPVKDFEAYRDLIDSLRVISNLKVIGIGQGATFVNQVVANHAGEVAGIVNIGGKAGKVSKEAAPVPAFVAGKQAAKIAKAYIQLNQAALQPAASGLRIYTNPAEPLLRVVVSEKDNQSLSDIFADAWQTLLSKNYRYNNFKHTHYEGARFGQYGPAELEPYVMWDELKVTRNIVEQDDRLSRSKYLWYEYLPEGVLNAERQSVPLVLLLHGFGNDPRTQAETSGWIEVAAREHFFVAELEWQGRAEYSAMGHDGIENVVGLLLQKYPQIDPERIYTEGLSAGAMTSSALGIRKSHLFAAVGAMSGGLFAGSGMFGGDGLLSEAIQKRGFVETAYIGVFGTDDTTIQYPTATNWKGNSVINAWKIYETMNGMDVLEDYDFAKEQTFGRVLRDRETIQTNKGISMEMGQLYKGDVPLMKLVAVNHYGHWNFKPAAQVMWDFFKHYSRDVKSKKLVYHP